MEFLNLMLITNEAKVESEGEIHRKIMDQVFPGVWDSNIPGRAKNAPPVQVKLKEGKQPELGNIPLKRKTEKGLVQ